MRTFLPRRSDERPTEDAIRERRIMEARRNSYSTELQETDLVRRGRLLVAAETDEIFTLYRGVVFPGGAALAAFNQQVPLAFYVDRDGDLVFLERRGGTWSELVARKARRQR